MGIEIEDVSPLAALIKGKGFAGGVPIVGAINKYRSDRKTKKEEDALAKEKKEEMLALAASGNAGLKPKPNTVQSTGMARGGVVKKRSIDGAALRGKTKGSRR